jgi:hypothetical protein
MKIFHPDFLSNIKKSKTMIFNMLLALLGVLEYNLHLFYTALGDNYGLVFVGIATVGAWLRILTTSSIEDK